MIHRFAEDFLYTWYQKKRRKPLVLRGARQVGKSTLVPEFAKNNGLVLNEINLEQHLYLDKTFQSLDLDIILRELEALVGRNINVPGSILFLDEIQATLTPLSHSGIFTRTGRIYLCAGREANHKKRISAF